MVIIPATAKDALRKASGNNNITFSSVRKLSADEYVKVCTMGDSHFLTAAVTEIFAGGYIHILIGTKSLLGEGWDSPCINSLIFSDKKDKAECFLSCVRPYIGKYELVYTRNEAGRRVLLAGRIKALANRQERCVTREKVLSELE